MASLLHSRDRRHWTSRTTAVAAIAVVHVAVIAIAMTARRPQRETEVMAPISVRLLPEQHAEPPPARPVVPPQELVIPVAVVPLINIDVPPDVPPPQITVAANPAPPAPPAPAASISRGNDDAPVRVTAVEFIRAPVLTYPAAAAQARASGTVYVQALVDADGRAREVHVLQSSGFTSLDKAAVESVRVALFKPLLVNGAARQHLVEFPLSFNLKVRGGRRDRGPPQDDCGDRRRRDHGRDDGACRRAGESPPQAFNDLAAEQGSP